ncbi:MAG TPA: hypothetical protein VLB01_00765 [Thermodesulfobacteriota bacterium]|nr:hypothetical protein [Thermodesulfobacteriota bacterium]
MEVQKAFHLAKREWKNIGSSLILCGDVGDLDFKGIYNGSERLSLYRDIVEMEDKFPKYGYSSKEAARVFDVLALNAGERLGLKGEFAKSFSSGYSLVRTGWYDLNSSPEKYHLIKQMFFLKLFFPFGGYSTTWDFESPTVLKKLELIFDTFFIWQKDPTRFVKDFVEYRFQLEPLWYGLPVAGGSPSRHFINSFG